MGIIAFNSATQCGGTSQDTQDTQGTQDTEAGSGVIIDSTKSNLLQPNTGTQTQPSANEQNGTSEANGEKETYLKALGKETYLKALEKALVSHYTGSKAFRETYCLSMEPPKEDIKKYQVTIIGEYSKGLKVVCEKKEFIINKERALLYDHHNQTGVSGSISRCIDELPLLVFVYMFVGMIDKLQHNPKWLYTATSSCQEGIDANGKKNVVISIGMGDSLLPGMDFKIDCTTLDLSEWAVLLESGSKFSLKINTSELNIDLEDNYFAFDQKAYKNVSELGDIDS